MQEEPSMDDILSSIRKMLSGEHRKENKRTQEPLLDKSEKKDSVQPEVFETSELGDTEEPFLLTPAMRVDQKEFSETSPILESEPVILEKEISTQIIEPLEKEKADDLTQVLEKEIKTDTEIEKDIKPFIQNWLDENLPDIVEKVVREEVGRVLARVLK